MPKDPDEAAERLAEASRRTFLSTVVGPEDLAAHLGIAEEAAFRLFERGAFPARRVDGRWCASKWAVLAWLDEGDPQQGAKRAVNPWTHK